MWPAGGFINGHLKKISIPSVASKTLYVKFPKLGRSTADCDNPSAVVTLADGQSSSTSQLEAIFGSEQPKFPLTFVACVGVSSGTVGNRVAINITYTIND